MKIVDPHHHFWDIKKLCYPWLSDAANDEWFIGHYESIRKNYFAEDFRRDTGPFEIVKSVHVEAGHHIDTPLLETRWLEQERVRTGLPSAIVAHADLSLQNAEETLAQHAEYASVRGIRQIINRHDDPFYNFAPVDYLHDSRWRENFALLSKYGLSFDLQCYPHQFSDFAALCARHPNIPVILNHTGMPLVRQKGGLAAWRHDMPKLAQLEHVSVKISGLGMMDPNWTHDTIRPIVLETIDLFGSERCMFASNFPVDKLFGSFQTHFEAFDSITADFGQSDRENVFQKTAERIYRI